MKRFINVLFTLTVLSNIIFLFVNLKDSYNNYVKENKLINDSLWNLKIHNNDLLLTGELMIKLQNEKLNNVLFSDENGDTTRLSDLISTYPKFIFKYSEVNCATCIDEQFKLIKEVEKKVGAHNIIIFTKYNSVRDLSKFIRTNKIEYRVLNMIDDKLSINDSEVPYYFILDFHCIIKHPYIPVPHYSEPVLEYFSEVSNIYF